MQMLLRLSQVCKLQSLGEEYRPGAVDIGDPNDRNARLSEVITLPFAGP
jgi:hypothetical protein